MYDYSEFSPARFNEDLSKVQWNGILSSCKNNVDMLFSSFYNKFNTIVNKHAPIKKNISSQKKSAFQALDYYWIKGIYKDEKQTLCIRRWSQI